METHRFSLFGEAAGAACVAAARAALQAWALDWCGAAPPWQIRCEAADRLAPTPALDGAWRCYSAGRAGALWLHVGAGVEAALAATLFPEPLPLPGKGSPLASAVVADALAALLAQLGEALAGAPCQEGAADAAQETQRLAQYRYGRGAALLSIVLGGATLQWLLPAACQPARPAQHGSAGRRPQVALLQALQGTPLRLRAEIGEVELSVGQLSVLAVGDVLTLPVGIDQALRVTAPGGQTLCAAQLGLRDGQRAIRLHPINTTKELT